MDDEPQEEFVVYPTGNPDYLDNLIATEQSGQQDGTNKSDPPVKKRGRPRRNPVVTVAANRESAKVGAEHTLIAKNELIDTSSNDTTASPLASPSRASPFLEHLMSPLFTRDIKDVPIGFMDVSERPLRNNTIQSNALDTSSTSASSKRQYKRKKLHWKTREKLEREQQKDGAQSSLQTDKNANAEDQPGPSRASKGIIRKKRTKKVWVATHALRQRKVIAKRRFSPSPTSQADNDSSESADEGNEVQNTDQADRDSSSEVDPPNKRFRSRILSSSDATTQKTIKRRGRPPSAHKNRVLSGEESSNVTRNPVEMKVRPLLKMSGKRGKGKLWNKRGVKKYPLSSRSGVAKRTSAQSVGLKRKRRSQYELLVEQPSDDTVAHKRTRLADSTVVSPEAPERTAEPVSSDEPTTSTPVLRRRKIKTEIAVVDPDTLPPVPINPPPYMLPTRVTKQQAKQEICELYDKIPDNLISMFHHHVKGFTAALTEENPVVSHV